MPADLRTRLTETPVKPWFNPFGKVQARLVRGTPWLEDLYRFPSNFVKVEFVPAEVGGTPEQLSEENIYSLFRRFGKIGDIVAQPADSKELPRYATVNYPLTRHAIMARNCMHGFIVTEELGGGKAGTMLRLSYIKRIRAHNIWNWLTGHPRIVIPILAALLAGFSVMIFDPIRQFFIKLHIHHSLSFSESRIYKWFLTHRDSFRFGTKKDANEDLNNIWNHRKEVITQLEEWVGETSSNFIVVTGPKGTGKVELVMERALKGRKDVLLFDCKPIVEARGEAATIKRLASTVGYRPVFSWANSISSLVDLAVQSTTGVKAGFSETLEAQLTKILYTTASALKDVGLCERNKKDKDATLSDDAYLEAHPERRPIVVIDNFLHKSDDNSVVYDKVSEWAASLVQNNAAQVIFVTSDGTFSKPLSKALPDRVFRVVSLGDLEPDVARSFVQGRLDAARPPEDAPVDADGKPRPSINIHGLDTAIETLGGRLMDLESLARRIQAGQSPRQATDEIVSECAIDTVKMFLMGKTSEDVQKHWSTEQVWHLVKGLAKEPSLRYNQVLLSSTFSSSLNPSGSSGTAALESLAAADLISIKSSRGHPKLISAAKPVQQAAFGLLTGDRVLNAKMDLALMTELSKIEAKTIDKAETELALLGSLPRQTFETAGRIQYLLTKLDASQQKILLLESNMAGLKKVLSEED